MRRSGPTVVLPEALARELDASATRWAPLETGGVLLGHSEQGGAELHVYEVVGAGPRARRATHRFDPDTAWQKRQIAARYEDSGRTLEYLGDWHSHPLGGRPSRLDRDTARRIAAAPNARCRHPLFLIVTSDGDGWRLRPYRWGRHRFRAVPVRVDGTLAAACSPLGGDQ